MNHITIGLNKLEFGEDFEWQVGFKNPTPIGESTQAFLKEVYFPCFAIIFDTEDDDEVVERMIQSLIEITEHLGSAIYVNRIDEILLLINNLLQNPQTKGHDQDAEGEFEDIGEGEDDQDLDHNETVLANITELVSVISRVMGEDFAEYFEETGELLFMHCGENYPMRDKSLCIGTLAECFNNMPSVLKKVFNQFYSCIMDTFKDAKNDDLIRNLSFAIGVCAELQPKLIKPKVKQILKTLNAVVDRVQDPSAKDNIVAALLKIATYNFDSVPFKSMANGIFESIPLKEDLDENESVSK